MENEYFTTEDYHKILKSRFETEDIELINAEIKPFSENVEGFLGEHFQLIIKYKLEGKEDTEYFFVKAKPRKSSYQRETANVVYAKEIHFYEKLLKQFEKYGYFTGFAPKCYYIKDNDILVMENLFSKGFRLFERSKFYDLSHCKAALKSIAYFHANSIIYEETKSKELGKKYRADEENIDAFKPTLFIAKDTRSKLFIESGLECFIQMSKLLDKPDEWKVNFEKKLKEIDCPKIFNATLPYRTTCSHGDLWSNNMLFNYENGVPINCTYVDFQLLRHFHPAYDVLLILNSNTRREFRKTYKNELFHYYYSIFSGILKDHGLKPDDILCEDDFLATVRHFESVALIQSVCTRTVVMMPMDLANSSVESKEGLEMFFFGKERAQFLLPEFETNDNFREIMTDDIYDLDEQIEYIAKI